MLVTCPECGAKVSGNVYDCPRCGFCYYQLVLGGGSTYKISAEYWPKNQIELREREKEKQLEKEAYWSRPIEETMKQAERRVLRESEERVNKGCLIAVIILAVIIAIVITISIKF